MNCTNFTQQQFGLKNHGIPAQQKALDVSRNFMRLQTYIYLILFFCNCNQKADKSKVFEQKSDQLVLKSKTLLDNNQLDSAQVYLQNALLLDPKNYAAYNNRAILKFKLNFPPESIIVDFEKSIEIKQDYDVALYSLTNYYFKIKDYQNTIKAANDYFMFAEVEAKDSAMTKHILSIKKTSESYAKMIDGISVSRAMLFYDSINHQIKINRPKIQKFIDKTTEAINSLKNDKKAVIDTRELILCLDTAKQMAKIRFFAVSKITEVDYQINYKQRVLNEERVLSSILNNEFEQCVKIFEFTGEDRYEKSSNLILSKLTELRKALDDVRSAKVEFKNKYGFVRQSK